MVHVHSGFFHVHSAALRIHSGALCVQSGAFSVQSGALRVHSGTWPVHSRALFCHKEEQKSKGVCRRMEWDPLGRKKEGVGAGGKHVKHT